MNDSAWEYLKANGIEKKVIEDRFYSLLVQICEVIKYLSMGNAVRIDAGLLEAAVVDYFVDIVRLKNLHGIERANVRKIYSYGVYWFLRRKPVQLTFGPTEHLHINEKIALFLLLPKMLEEMSLLGQKTSEAAKCFAELLYYSLKHRTYTQDSLELMNEAFFCGVSLCKPDR